MKRKALATQEARHINEIGALPSNAPQSNSLVQTVLQGFLINLPSAITYGERKCPILFVCCSPPSP
ncbi:MAG: hypothetical protein ORN21_00305 [Methylophilaceae bacterium]|nr:hypothetical protein [Methylophilaceae bacterium]